jgi:hypothetical protein
MRRNRRCPLLRRDTCAQKRLLYGEGRDDPNAAILVLIAEGVQRME